MRGDSLLDGNSFGSCGHSVHGRSRACNLIYVELYRNHPSFRVSPVKGTFCGYPAAGRARATARRARPAPLHPRSRFTLVRVSPQAMLPLAHAALATRHRIKASFECRDFDRDANSCRSSYLHLNGQPVPCEFSRSGCLVRSGPRLEEPAYHRDPDSSSCETFDGIHVIGSVFRSIYGVGAQHGACCELCLRLVECHAWTWDAQLNGTCRLHTARGPTVSRAGSFSVASSSARCTGLRVGARVNPVAAS